MVFKSIREQFHHPKEDQIFLNHAGVSPLPASTANWMKQVIDMNCTMTPKGWHAIQINVSACRQAIARLVNVNENEIALTRNTTESINWVANGIDWHVHDRIVSVLGEYPANIYPWMRLRDKGVIFHLIQPQDHRITVEMIENEITPTTRLIAISLVQFTTGFRCDLEAIGALCKERGILFLVDLIQGLGAVSVDLKRAQVSFASCGAQKWMLGPQGAGFFYCAPECMPLIDVTTVGSDSMSRPIPYLDYEYELRKDAARFEYATHATVCIAGMRQSAQLLLEADPEKIQEQIKGLTDILVDGATQKGYVCHSPRRNNEWSGIVSFTHPVHSNDSVIQHMRSKNIAAFEREGNIRLAPHFYQTEDEMKRVVDAM